MTKREDEIRYHIEIEPPLHAILNRFSEDADSGAAPFTSEELLRAVWLWADEKLNAGPRLPEWFIRMLEQRNRGENNTIEGDAGGG